MTAQPPPPPVRLYPMSLLAGGRGRVPAHMSVDLHDDEPELQVHVPAQRASIRDPRYCLLPGDVARTVAPVLLPLPLLHPWPKGPWWCICAYECDTLPFATTAPRAHLPGCIT